MLGSYERRLAQCRSEISGKEAEISENKMQLLKVTRMFEELKSESELKLEGLRKQLEDKKEKNFQSYYNNPQNI